MTNATAEKLKIGKLVRIDNPSEKVPGDVAVYGGYDAERKRTLLYVFPQGALSPSPPTLHALRAAEFESCQLAVINDGYTLGQALLAIRLKYGTSFQGDRLNYSSITCHLLSALLYNVAGDPPCRSLHCETGALDISVTADFYRRHPVEIIVTAREKHPKFFRCPVEKFYSQGEVDVLKLQEHLMAFMTFFRTFYHDASYV